MITAKKAIIAGDITYSITYIFTHKSRSVLGSALCFLREKGKKKMVHPAGFEPAGMSNNTWNVTYKITHYLFPLEFVCYCAY